MGFKKVRKSILLILAGITFASPLSSCVTKVSGDDLITEDMDIEMDVFAVEDYLEKVLTAKCNLKYVNILDLEKVDDDNHILCLDGEAVEDVTKGKFNCCISFQIPEDIYKELSLNKVKSHVTYKHESNHENYFVCNYQYNVAEEMFNNVFNIAQAIRNDDAICISIYNKDRDSYAYKNEELVNQINNNVVQMQ